MRIFQYARTSDPEVVAVVEANMATSRDMHERAMTFAERFGASGYYGGDWAGSRYVSALALKKAPEGAGQWRREQRGMSPYKNNPLRAEFAALSVTEQPVPGMPETIQGQGNPDGSRTVYTPRPFLHDGVVWVGLGGAPSMSDPHSWGKTTEYDDRWQECLASEYHAAREAAIAAEKEDSDD